MAPEGIRSIPIADLNPDLQTDQGNIAGIVTLIWPYSSVQKTFSLLLVEPDFRLRAQRGQVRLFFDGPSAKALSKAGVESGSFLHLNLKGASFERDDTTISTPGRGIEWKLRYGQFLDLQIRTEAGRTTSLLVDNPPPSPKTTSEEGSNAESPLYNSHIPVSVSKPRPGRLNDFDSWSSPALLKRSYLASSTHNVFDDEEDLEFPDNDRRKRIKFGQASGQWRFADRTPSPIKDEEVSTMDISTPTNPQIHQSRKEPPSQSDSNFVATSNARIPSTTEQQRPRKSEETHGALERSENTPVAPEQTNKSPVAADKEAWSSSNGTEGDRKTQLPSLQANSALPQTPVSLKGHQVVKDDNGLENVPSQPSEPSIPSSIPSSLSQGYAMKNSSREPPPKLNVSPKLFREPTHDGPVASQAASEIAQPQTIAFNRTTELLVAEKDSSTDLTGKAIVETNVAGISAPPIANEIATPSPNHDEQAEEEQNHHWNILADDEDRPDKSSSSSEIEDQGKVAKPIGVADEQAISPPSTSMPETKIQDVPGKVSAPKTIVTEKPSLVGQAGAADDSGDHTKGTDKSQDNGLFTDAEKRYVAGQYRDSHSLPPIMPVMNTEVVDLESEVGEDDFAAFDDARAPADFVKKPTDALTTKRDVQTNDSVTQKSQQKPLPNLKSNGEAAKSNHGDMSEKTKPSRNLVDIIKSKTQAEFITAEQFIQEQLATENLDLASLPSKHREEPGEVDNELQDQSESQKDHAVPQQTQPVFAEASTHRVNTVPDSMAVRSSEQLLTPTTTQKTSFNTQASDVSLQTVPDPETLLSPRLTQEEERIDSPLRGESFAPVQQIGRTLQQPLQYPEATLYVSQRPHQETKDSLPARQEDPVKADDAYHQKGPMQTEAPLQPDDVMKQDEVPKHEDAKVSSEEPVENPTSQPPPFSPITPVKQRSKLIERLKALRRPSDASSRNSSFASPWFAPRRLSQVVPDSEAESVISELGNGEASAETGDLTPKKSAATFSTPTKPLSQTFVRSSPLGNDLVSPSSTQYTPQFQPLRGGLRTRQGYFVALRSLSSHFGTLTDVLALAVSSTSISRADKGQRDWTLSCYLTDGSMLAHGSFPLVTAQIFRPHRRSLPQLQQYDSVILRNFKVQFSQRRIALISTDTSAWAVFRDRTSEPQIKGPPLEIGPEERAYARKTREWWFNLAPEQRKRLVDATPPPPLVTSPRTSANKSAKAKQEGINGIGIDLPGSQGSSRDGPKKGNLYSTQALAKAWTTALIRSSEPEASSGDEKPNITGRVLRPRDRRGKTKSVSPEKEDLPRRRGRSGARRGGSRAKSIEIEDSESDKQRPSRGKSRRGKSVEVDNSESEFEVKV